MTPAGGQKEEAGGRELRSRSKRQLLPCSTQHTVTAGRVWKAVSPPRGGRGLLLLWSLVGSERRKKVRKQGEGRGSK